MKQVLIKSGSAQVTEVPAPRVSPSGILVGVQYSCVSVGTEMASIRTSGLPLYRRALKQPQHVRRFFEMIAVEGVASAVSRLTGKLAAGSATGYSAAGTVLAVGERVSGFTIGDLVACAGAGIANHAEVIDVPVNLAVQVPPGLDMSLASSVTLGAIALQGIRRAEPTLGETFVVVGLGLLGQLAAQMLAANGCRVLGVDPDSRRRSQALEKGMDCALDSAVDDYTNEVLRHTGGFGADGVMVTAATSSDEVISLAMRACRRKGRVVLVGDVGLSLRREDFYRKELDFLISTSYGPGRYDPAYEEEGQDYPIAYVRWTENRNMEAYLHMLARGQVSLQGFYTEPFDIADARAAYERLNAPGDRPLMVFLRYPQQAGERTLSRKLEMRIGAAGSGRFRVALAGASSFAQAVHLPNLHRLKEEFAIHAIMSRTGANARNLAAQFGAAYCSTDYDEVLRDPATDLVLIATRHDLHGPMALAALKAGKHVLVEKPLGISAEQIDELARFLAGRVGSPVLMVGYNRRFSPPITRIVELLASRATPMIVNYRMNAGYIPREHWVHGPEGGGRNLGEACHIYDLFVHLCGVGAPIEVSATAISPRSQQWRSDDNFIATLKFADGSVCTLTYTSMGEKSHPKERMEIFADGKVIVMDDYKSVTVHGLKSPRVWDSKVARKGHLEELRALARSLAEGGQWPISADDLLASARVALQVEQLIRR